MSGGVMGGGVMGGEVMGGGVVGGEVVGGGVVGEAMSDRPEPVSRRYEDVTVGEELPGLSIPLTRTMIVATAMASRDYQDVHHDPGLAAERGSKDIFMNILTTNGLVERYVTGWAGPAAVVRAIKIRLGAPNYPGDTMVLTGTVSAKHDADRQVEIAVRGVNAIGPHVTGTVVVRLPARCTPAAQEGGNP